MLAPAGPPGSVSPAPLFGSGISHLAQYFAEAGFSAPHFEQAFIIGHYTSSAPRKNSSDAVGRQSVGSGVLPR